MTIDSLKRSLLNIVEAYPIRRITLFGSRADGTNREDSDTYDDFKAPLRVRGTAWLGRRYYSRPNPVNGHD